MVQRENGTKRKCKYKKETFNNKNSMKIRCNTTHLGGNLGLQDAIFVLSVNCWDDDDGKCIAMMLIIMITIVGDDFALPRPQKRYAFQISGVH